MGNQVVLPLPFSLANFTAQLPTEKLKEKKQLFCTSVNNNILFQEQCAVLEIIFLYSHDMSFRVILLVAPLTNWTGHNSQED